MLTLDQLMRWRELCVGALNRASGTIGSSQPDSIREIYIKRKEQATAALADIDEELALLKQNDAFVNPTSCSQQSDC